METIAVANDMRVRTMESYAAKVDGICDTMIGFVTDTNDHKGKLMLSASLDPKEMGKGDMKRIETILRIMVARNDCSNIRVTTRSEKEIGLIAECGDEWHLQNVAAAG